MNLELMAMRWLWQEKNCHYILEKRTPRYHLGEPDVLGVTANRYLIEIEIKRSASDFHADKNKYCRRNRDLFEDYMAKQFYYLMPRELAEKLKDKIPAWAGLMCPAENNYTAEVLKVAPSNSKSKRLSVKECVKLCRAMTNHMMSYAQKMATKREQFKNYDTQIFVDWVHCEHGTYEI
jgi:hypothetical protein